MFGHGRRSGPCYDPADYMQAHRNDPVLMFRSERRPAKIVLILSSLLILAALVFAPLLIVARVMPGWYPVQDVEDARMARFPEGTIRYQEAGEGDTVILLLHGFNAHLGQWERVWRELDRCACRRIRIDIPGFGQSDWRADDFGLEQQSARIVALLDRLGVRQVAVAGTSMGGSIAAWMAARDPERVSHVVLMSPSGFPGSLTYPGLFGKLVRPGPLNGAATWIARTRLYSKLFPRSRAMQALTVTASYGAPWEAALAGIRAPTLVLWSRQDKTANPMAAERVRAAIPDSALVWLDEATGHSIPTERPELAAQAITLLIQGTSPGQVAEALPPDLWRPGERPHTP